MQSQAVLRAFREFEEYYDAYVPLRGPLLAQQEILFAREKDADPHLRKAAMIELLCRECPVHVFRESPFFFEINCGKNRFTWGGLDSPVSGFIRGKYAAEWLDPYGDALEADRDAGYMYGWNNPVGFDHHCLGYDRLLAEGVEGMIARAEAALVSAGETSRPFLEAVVRSCRALIALAGRFADRARELAAEETGEARAHYARIAETAARVPALPPRTFYEALAAIVFYRETVGTLEGIGVSTLGQLDRMLEPYYAADLDAGRITRQEALDMLGMLLAYTDARFAMRRQQQETSTTVMLGGCDREGHPVFGEVTRMVLEAEILGRYIGTKINCRISSAHPRAYMEAVAEVQLAGLPVLVLQNDDVLIPARVRQGQAEEDARLYAAGGCHETVLAGTEMHTRADTWINMPRLLLHTLETCGDCPDFASFYAAFLTDARAYHEKIVALKNAAEARWSAIDPLPLYSAGIDDCIARGRDITSGGARYSSTSLSMVGAATLVDSLYALRELVWGEGRLSLAGLRTVLAGSFAGEEALRQYIIRRLPKFGDNSPELHVFAAGVLADLAGLAGQKNARGGRYLPAFYPHDMFLRLGERTGATPDGRRTGAPLSRGCAPSEFVEIASPLDVIRSLTEVDFTAYADSFCAELTLPLLKGEEGKRVLCALADGFLAAGGSSMQFNLLDRDELEAARRDPENHAGLIVRVCGYSEVFVHLRPEQQEEIIGRTIR